MVLCMPEKKLQNQLVFFTIEILYSEIDMCPVCIRKMQHVLKVDLEIYLEQLANFYKTLTIPQFAKDTEWYTDVLADIKAKKK